MRLSSARLLKTRCKEETTRKTNEQLLRLTRLLKKRKEKGSVPERLDYLYGTDAAHPCATELSAQDQQSSPLLATCILSSVKLSRISGLMVEGARRAIKLQRYGRLCDWFNA